jgi:hypothetical protein
LRTIRGVPSTGVVAADYREGDQRHRAVGIKMAESSRPAIRIDLNDFKLHLQFKSKTQLTLHFNSPSRRFYLSVIALVVNEMKKLGKIKSISLRDHLDLLALLNESVGGAAGSSDKENLLPRVYIKWRNALPDLEEAPLFKVLGKKKEEGEGVTGRIYRLRMQKRMHGRTSLTIWEAMRM